MPTDSYALALKIAVAVSLAATLYVNYLSQRLPLNGLTQGDISDSLPNLFTPAGFTFSIWGIIYLMLTVFAVFQFGWSQQTPNADLLGSVRMLFVINMLANIVWLFVWHYRKFGLSLAVMAVILITLIFINLAIDKLLLTAVEKIVFRLPFSLYFGWITVAAAVNVTCLLVARGWKRFGLAEQGWANMILVVAALIGTVTMLVRHDIAYGLVFIWAYWGILMKHKSPAGFAKKYPLIIRTIMACLFVFTVSEVLMIFKVL